MNPYLAQAVRWGVAAGAVAVLLYAVTVALEPNHPQVVASQQRYVLPVVEVAVAPPADPAVSNVELLVAAHVPAASTATAPKEGVMRVRDGLFIVFAFAALALGASALQQLVRPSREPYEL